MAKRKPFSARPSDAEKGGGKFGFPAGSIVTVEEVKATTFEEAGEDSCKNLQKRPGDPCLKIVGQVEGREESTPVFLAAGKMERVEPSRDGEFFQPAEGSTSTGLNDNCAVTVFIASLCDKKRHGKMALPEEVMDGGYSALEGLKFVAGSEKKTATFEGEGEKTFAQLIANQIVKLPKSAGKAKDDDDDDADEKPKGKGSKDADDDDIPSKPSGKKDAADDGDDDDASDAAERAVIGLFENPKFRKGLPANRVIAAVFNATRDAKNQEDITTLVGDKTWMQSKKRPWTYDKGEDQYLSVDA